MREKGRLRDDLGSWKIEIGNSKFGRGCWRGLGEAIGAEEIEEAEVAEDLELLADFVADVAEWRVKSKPAVFKSKAAAPGYLSKVCRVNPCQISSNVGDFFKSEFSAYRTRPIPKPLASRTTFLLKSAATNTPIGHSSRSSSM